MSGIKGGDEIKNPTFIGIEGRVTVQMPNGMYLQLTSEHARSFANKLYIAAAQADGEELTHLAVIPVNDRDAS